MKKCFYVVANFVDYLFQNIFYINIIAFVVGLCYAISSDFTVSAGFYLTMSFLSILAIIFYLKLILLGPLIVLCAIFSFFLGIIYLSCFNNIFLSNEIKGRFIANVTGQILQLKESKNGSKNIILKVSKISKPQWQSKQKSAPKSKKVTKNYIRQNFQNLENFSDIDRRFIELNKGYANINWQQIGDEEILVRPPKRLQISFSNKKLNHQIGDKIKVKVFFESGAKRIFLEKFNFENYFKSKLIDNRGFAISDSVLIEKSDNHSQVNVFFNKLRVDIIKKIQSSNVNSTSRSLMLAMLTSDRSKINDNDYQVIKTSGLAHLISISGLHMSLAAGIFFVIFRYLLIRSQYLALNFDIRKISAFLAIFSSYIYLNIANFPISAIRAFIAICFFMIAILVNKKTSSLRIVFFAALIIALINPYSILQISYQLSFAAILAIVTCRQILHKTIHQYQFFNQFNKNKISYFLKITIELLAFSLAAQIATTPFLIYHFGNYPIYSILANLFAVPIASLVTMPLGFISLFLMIFDCHNLSLIPMSLSLDVIFKIAQIVTNIKSSRIDNAFMPINILILIILTFLILAISRNNIVRLISFITMISLIFFPYQKSLPLLMIDYSSSNVIINKRQDLLFIKKPKKSKKLSEIMLYFNKSNYKIVQNCKKSYCELDLWQNINKKMLVITNRSPLNEVCNQKYDLVINLTKKYQMPKCFNGSDIILIDNWDLLRKGNHFIYIKDGHLEIDSIN